MARPNAAQTQDLTAKRDAELRAEQEALLAARASELATIHQAEADNPDEVVDLTVKPEPAAPVGPIVLGAEDAVVTVRLNSDIEDMTVGAGNMYTFKRGAQYKVPKNVADRLEELGYVWH